MCSKSAANNKKHTSGREQLHIILNFTLHVHLVLVPEYEDSLSRLFRVVHRDYTRRINFREHWKGHLWQERFHSFVMDESYLLATARHTGKI